MVSAAYELISQNISETGVKYFFISKGPKNIIKADEYFYFTDYHGWRVYNLGFGDYDISKDKIDDKVNTENGDAYQVFNTVLSTVPEFFNSFADAAVMVRGSDSTNEFENQCRQTCRSKSCKEICRKKHQRIRTYCSYVTREYETLIQGYEFFGGVEIQDDTVIEHFKKNKFYNSVLLVKK
jgi:hypothetical protein